MARISRIKQIFIFKMSKAVRILISILSIPGREFGRLSTLFSISTLRMTMSMTSWTCAEHRKLVEAFVAFPIVLDGIITEIKLFPRDSQGNRYRKSRVFSRNCPGFGVHSGWPWPWVTSCFNEVMKINIDQLAFVSTLSQVTLSISHLRRPARLCQVRISPGLPQGWSYFS